MQAQSARPNILWLTCEDISPNLGCYGDAYAVTPNLDELAKRSVRYLHAWSNAPVCAPARTTIISGMYPPSTGGEHMRSMTHLAPTQKMYPVYLREAGYYCTNNVKEDYNLEHTGKVWDESSNKAHWRNRKPGQPFFAIFNNVGTHESQIRKRPHTFVHDPAKARVPAYHPDTPETRQDWAEYYDNITAMDKWAAGLLADLKKDGLDEDTIVFFYGDHGSGMPRSKRWPFNSGLQVPLLVHIPEKWRSLAPKDYVAGGTSERLVSFVDLAPTLLSLAGIPKPSYYQGHAFLGTHAAPEQPYVYGFRGRMDERYDMVRSVRDKRYVYVRNFMPHRIYGQYIAYMFQTPTTSKWYELYNQGKLNDAQRKFWEKKPAEELYDLQSDPDEVKNLAQVAEHRKTLERMRKAQHDLAVQIRDVGYLPEDEIHRRSGADAPYTMGHDVARFDARKIIGAADVATRSPKASDLLKLIADADSGVRYWGATGFLVAGEPAAKPNLAAIEKLLNDDCPSVKIVAAEVVAAYGEDAQRRKAMEVLLTLADVEKNGYYLATQAMNAVDNLGAKVAAYKARVAKLPRDADSVHDRVKQNLGNLIDHFTK